MNKYLDFVLKHPRLVLAIIATTTVILGFGIPRLEFDNSVDVMMPQHDAEFLHYENIKKIHGNIGKFIIINATDKNIWSREFFTKLNDFITILEEYKTFNPELEDKRIAAVKEAKKKAPVPFDELLALFPNDRPFQNQLRSLNTRLFQGKDTLTEKEFKALLKQLHTSYALKKASHIDLIESPLTTKDMSGADDTLSSVPIIPTDDAGRRILPGTEKEFSELRDKLTKNPAFEKALYAVDPATKEITDFAVVIRIKNIKKDDKLADEIWNITQNFKGIDLTMQGIPIVNKKMNDYMRADLVRFLPPVLLVVLIVFYLNFMTVRGVVLPFISLILGDIWIMGLMGHLGIKMTMMAVSLPCLMVAVGSSYSIHIMNEYYHDFNMIKREGVFNGLKLSFSHISNTVYLAGFTTFLGFFSLITNQVTGIREWGICSAVGVLFAVIISVSFIPACLILLPNKNPSRIILNHDGSKKRTWIDPIIEFCAVVSVKHHRIIMIVIACVLAWSFAGIYKLKVETSALAFFKKTDSIHASSNLIGQKYGGSIGMSILIDSGVNNGVKDPEFLNTIDEICTSLKKATREKVNVERTDSFVDVIKSMHKVMNNNKDEYYSIPKTKQEIVDYIEVYAGDDDNYDGRPDTFERYVDPQYRTALIFAKIWGSSIQSNMGTYELSKIEDKTSQYLTERLKGRYAFSITGEPTILIRLSNYIVSGQLLSLVFSLAAVALVVVLLFKNWGAGLIACIPLTIAVLVNFGIMGWFNITLDSATALIASITIGIGVDDTIHFLNTFRHYRREGLSIDETLKKVIMVAGKAIIYTSVALVFGFGVLILSNFMPVVQFGLLIAITMIATTIGALIILPTAIKASGFDLKENGSNSLFWRIFYIGKYFKSDKSE